jgi:hypothetical protein
MEQVLRRSPYRWTFNEAYNTLPIPTKQVKKTNSKERYFYVQDGTCTCQILEVAMIQVSLITLDLYDGGVF